MPFQLYEGRNKVTTSRMKAHVCIRAATWYKQEHMACSQTRSQYTITEVTGGRMTLCQDVSHSASERSAYANGALRSQQVQNHALAGCNTSLPVAPDQSNTPTCLQAKDTAIKTKESTIVPSLPLSVEHAGSPTSVLGKRKRSTRVCNRCRQRRIKCNVPLPCTACVTAGLDCKAAPQRKRGIKTGSRARITNHDKFDI